MNVTFLIGNGFDLNLGLKTSYKDFLDYYIKNNEEDCDIIKCFKNDINKDITLWGDAELAFGQYTANEWLDADKYCECHEHFVTALAQYLKEQEDLFDASCIQGENLSNFKEAINSFHSYFRESEQNKLSIFLNKFRSGFNFNFIIFNYTKLFDRWITQQNTIGTRTINGVGYKNITRNIHHVHGTTAGNLIFGVDNVNQIKNLKLFKGCTDLQLEQVIKIEANKMHENLSTEKALRMINESNLFYVYGMSIGESDKLWWKAITEKLSKDENSRVLIHCHDAPKRNISSRKYIIHKRNIIKRFLENATSDTEVMTQLSERFHITAYNIFNKISNLALKNRSK